jgi:hypothetical protein
LRSSSGIRVRLSSVFSVATLGSCDRNLSLLRADESLDPNETYVLVTTTAFGRTSESEPFYVDARKPTTENTPVEVTTTLEAVEPVSFESGFCADPQIQGRLFDTLLHVHVIAPLRTPLIVIARVEDADAGYCKDANAPLSVQESGDVSLTIPWSAASGQCVDVELVDLSAKPVFHDILCPSIKSSDTRRLNLPLFTIPAPLIPKEDDPGCSLKRSSSRLSALRDVFITLVTFSVFHRLRRNRTGK